MQSKSNPWALCVHTLLGWEVWEEAELSPSECLSRDQITELLSSVWGLVHANADIFFKTDIFSLQLLNDPVHTTFVLQNSSAREKQKQIQMLKQAFGQ